MFGMFAINYKLGPEGFELKTKSTGLGVPGASSSASMPQSSLTVEAKELGDSGCGASGGSVVRVSGVAGHKGRESGFMYCEASLHCLKGGGAARPPL